MFRDVYKTEVQMLLNKFIKYFSTIETVISYLYTLFKKFKGFKIVTYGFII